MRGKAGPEGPESFFELPFLSHETGLTCVILTKLDGETSVLENERMRIVGNATLEAGDPVLYLGQVRDHGWYGVKGELVVLKPNQITRNLRRLGDNIFVLIDREQRSSLGKPADPDWMT